MRKSTWGVLALLGLAGSCAPRDAAPAASAQSSALGVPAPIAHRVKDLNPGPGDGLPERLKPHFSLHALGSTLFLRADDGVGGPALWRSDGTEAGTRLVKDFTPDAVDGLGDEPAVLDGAMYFFADAGSDLGLWKMTESAEAPELVHSLSPRGPGPTYYLRALGSALSFMHTAADTGMEPWVTDGTAAGTQLLLDIRPGLEDSDPRPFRNANGRLFFAANDGVHGRELWTSDGSAAGTRLVKDLDPTGNGFAEYAAMHTVGDTVYFAATDGVLGQSLWRSDGTEAGTSLVKGPGSEAPMGELRDMAHVGSTLFFTTLEWGTVAELWATDGTPEGTVALPLAQLPLMGEGVFGGLLALEDRLVFVGPGSSGGPALWSSDGSPEGTVRVKDVAVHADNFYGYQVLDGLLVFRGDDGVHGKELWRSDGTPEGTFMVADVRPGPESSDASHFALAGNTLYFRATDGVSGYEPWAIPMAKVHDPFAPTVTCPADITVMQAAPLGAPVFYPSAEASDDSGAPVVLHYAPPSGSTFRIGTTPVVVTATDAAQNTVSCTFQVTLHEADASIPHGEHPEGVSACASSPGAPSGTWLALLGLLAFTRGRRSRSGHSASAKRA